VSQQRSLGVNARVLEASLGKRLEELMSGKGGLVSFLWWLVNLDFVEDLPPLVNDISLKYTFIDTALSKASKECLNRPEFMREEEIATLLGYTCTECGFRESALDHRYQKTCPKCGKNFTITYLLIHKQLRALNIVPTPEAVLIWFAYEGLADAYLESYSALQKVFKFLMEYYGLISPFQFVNAEFKDKFDAQFYYYEPGDTRYSKEERELLMFLVRGNLAQIPYAEAEKIIRLGIEVCKFGYILNKLNCSGADFQYYQTIQKFTALYNPVNERIRLATVIPRSERDKKPVIEVEKLDEAQYYPCSLLPRDGWDRGKLAKHIVMKPMIKGELPIYTDEENVGMNCWVAPSGSGKTVFMGAAIYHRVDWAKEYVFNVLSDEKNGLSLACIPLFPCEGHTNELIKILADMGVQPKPIPCLNLVFLRPSEERTALSKNKMSSHPPTIYDRIVEMDNGPHSFGLEFWTGKKAQVESKGVTGDRGILNILEEFAINLGYKRLCGLINVRNLLRQEETEYNKKTKVDIAIGATLFNKFMTFRQETKFPAGTVSIDELARFAPMVHLVGGGDTTEAAATLNESVKAMRGCNLSFDTATQSWSEIQPESKKEKKNVFFRELPKSTDKGRSQRFLVLGDLDLKEGDDDLVTSIMAHKAFPKDAHLWFWWNKETGEINVIRPNPPPFMLNQPKKTNLEVFKAYERYSGEKVLLDSWDDVPRLHYENTEYFNAPEMPA